ncbi:hypothetical protein ACJJTC_007944 [Scirpophaga incertulas]
MEKEVYIVSKQSNKNPHAHNEVHRVVRSRQYVAACLVAQRDTEMNQSVSLAVAATLTRTRSLTSSRAPACASATTTVDFAFAAHLISVPATTLPDRSNKSF